MQQHATIILCIVAALLGACEGFRGHQMQRAMEGARRVLDDNKRGPVMRADQVPHHWEDKYLLTEWITDSTLASIFHGLTRLGLTTSHTEQLLAWAAANHSVYLQFDAEERTDLLEERTREVESGTVEKETVTESWLGETVEKVRTKVKRKVPEWVWEVHSSYNISVVRGNGRGEAHTLLLMGRAGKEQLVSTTRRCPRSTSPRSSESVPLNWLLAPLQTSSEGLEWGFRVERERAATPCRNAQVEAVLEGAARLSSWVGHTKQRLLPVLRDTTELVFDSGAEPFLLPLLRCVGSPHNQSCAALDASDTNKLLQEAAGTLDRKAAEFRKPGPNGEPTFPEGDSHEMFSVVEAEALLALRYMEEAGREHREALAFVENMIHEQLEAAIGSEVTADSFARYMQHHNRRLFNTEYSPSPFSLSVRHSEQHSPEGSLSIENAAGPVHTLSATSSAPAAPMSFALDASTSVRFRGTRHLHAFLDHKFSSKEASELKLIAQARQFSSMVLVLGVIEGKHSFAPTHAVIVQNKDELTVPLALAAIPSPKEFRAAVESLSSTQREFAKALRGMQLQSTLFGMMVIEVKPQLERVLGLPPGGLTKEIKLTQQLMSLLLEHQVPSDLLSYTEDAKGEPVEQVREHVAAMHGMIALAKAEQLQEQEQLHKYKKAQRSVPVFEAAEYSANVLLADTEHIDTDQTLHIDTDQTLHIVYDTIYGMHLSPATTQDASVTQDPSETKDEPIKGDEPEGRAEPGCARDGGGAGQGAGVDYSAIVAEMDERIERMDSSGALRPTVINVQASGWLKRSRKGLLGELERHGLTEQGQQDEKARAFGLLDALTRGGGLELHDVALHVVVAATHLFDKSVMHTLVQDNVNPIDRVERSTLILAACVHRAPLQNMVASSQMQRVSGYSDLIQDKDQPETSSTKAAEATTQQQR